MDIQTNIDMLMQADFKDWHYYENQQKLQELREKLEQAERVEQMQNSVK